MIKNHKIIASVFAGRQDRMSILMEYLKILLSKNLIDELHIWDYTRNSHDKEWINTLQSEKIKIFNTIPNSKWQCYYEHYRECFFPPDTVLIKIDDDIVYIDIDQFENFIKFRIDNPEYFLISANIINNGVCAGIQQRYGMIPSDICPPNGFPYEPYYGKLWGSGELAQKLHLYFLDNIFKFRADGIHIQPIGERISINFISILGKDFKYINHVYNDDEHLLSVERPKQLRRHNCIFMPLVVSHLSFYAQDGRLDKSLLLDRYKKLINEYGNMLSIKINLIKDHTDYLNIIPMLGISGENIHEQSHSLLSYTNTGLRLWQNPKQLASLSKFMEDKHILSYLEIGALHGGTFIYLSEFFSKKNNDIKLYACDIKPMSDLLKDYSKIRKFAYYQKSSQSADFKQTINRIKPEFVLIDGDHSYDNAKKDFLLFENLKNTKYILLHDIVNDACPDIKKLWTELKNNNKFDHHEFTEQYNDTPGGGKYFGFGLLVRKL